MASIKGFIKDYNGNRLLPITRGELVLDKDGQIALISKYFEAGVNGNTYGLISATDLAKLKGEGTGQSMSDIYDKLAIINSSLTVGNTSLHFYDEDGKATTININGIADQINVSSTNNGISIGLSELEELSASNILKSITVDKYGRVIAVSGAPLTSAEIPNLDGQTISNGILNGCTTSAETIADNKLAVVNKSYVDAKIAQVEGVATGALTFGGAISSRDYAIGLLNKVENFNNYYKVISDFILPNDYLYSETEVNSNGNIKSGDTLIVYKIGASESKFIHIPSGDEDVTRITIKESGASNAVDGKLGHISFIFDSLFNVNSTDGYAANISIPAANGITNGYLSAEDYVKFSNYASNLKVVYESSITEGATGSYQIGTITIGNTEHKVIGYNNISTLTLENGSNNNIINPILKFVESGVNGSTKNITIEGSNGVKAEKSGDTIKLTGAYTVETLSTDYLQVQNGQIGVKFGSIAENTITEGIVKYSDFIINKENVDALITFVQQAQALTLSGSLITGATGSNGEIYKYGDSTLITAVTVEI